MSMNVVSEPQQGKRRHKLLPQEIRQALPPLYSQDGKGMDAIVHLKLFNAFGRGTWYITEGSVVIDGDEGTVQQQISLADAYEPSNGYLDPGRIKAITFFGYCVSPLGPDCNEFGYADFDELATIKVFGRIPAIERDCYFDTGKMTVRECLEKNA